MMNREALKLMLQGRPSQFFDAVRERLADKASLQYDAVARDVADTVFVTEEVEDLEERDAANKIKKDSVSQSIAAGWTDRDSLDSAAKHASDPSRYKNNPSKKLKRPSKTAIRNRQSQVGVGRRIAQGKYDMVSPEKSAENRKKFGWATTKRPTSQENRKRFFSKEEVELSEENSYVAFYNQKRVEVYAATTYEAQKKAAAKLGVSEKNRHKIAVKLAERDGKQVTHKPLD